jgi:hypothetical protein
MDEIMKKQLVTLAAYSIISGVVILATLIIHIGIKKAISNMKDQLRRSEEPPEHEKA